MGLFDNLKNLIFEEEKSTSAPKATAASQTIPLQNNAPQQVKSTQTASASSFQQNPLAMENFHKEFYKSLSEAIDASNLPGFDLYEFRQLYQKFVKEGKPDDKALKDAIASSEIMRVDKNALISNYQHYLSVMNEEKTKFENAMRNYFQDHIQEPKNTQVTVDREIEEKKRLIAQYEKDIQDLMQKKKNLGIDAIAAEEKLNNLKTAFTKAFQEVMESFKNVVEKLKTM